jgi:uncharacterized membrane protein (DUF2068 family)
MVGTSETEERTLSEGENATPPAVDVMPPQPSYPSPAPGPSTPAANGYSVPPGAGPHRKRRPEFHYELVACALHGHSLVGKDAAEVRPEDGIVVREHAGVRWHRCLRCDSWLPLHKPEVAGESHVPTRDEVAVPLRGLPLRDRFVLRVIAVDRVIHFLVLAVFALAILLFAQDRGRLKGEYTRVLNALQGAVGGPLFDTKHNRLIGDINELFKLSTTKLYLFGFAIAAYAVLNGVEAIGLWRARRWAEYLTLLELTVLLPIEIYELTITVTTLKSLTLALNLAIVLYLLVAHRLFGVRGGGKVELAERMRDTGWPAIERTTPPFQPELSSTG